ncbi:MAG: response regulator [Hyphomonadaceae bacterium]|nr:response regulator [Hyphomonadaceae bacterium]
MADIREQLLAAFEVEYREHVDAIRAALEQARAGQTINVREVFRRAHSLKGAARAVDLPEIEEAAHAMEALFVEAMDAGGTVSPVTGTRVLTYLDAIERHASIVYKRGLAVGGGDDAAPEQATEYLRVNAGRVQQLFASMHDLSTNLDMLDVDANELSEIQARADGLARLLERQSRSAVDLSRVTLEVRAIARSLASAIRVQKEAARGSVAAAMRLREEIERVALVPATTVFAGMESMLREMAEESGKRIDVKIEGLETQADRLLLQSLRDPVIHLLRNAVAHGMETPLDRHSTGKPERGEIGLRVTARAGKLEIVVYDDGRGPDLHRIEQTAIQRELLAARAERDAPPTPERLLAIVFEPGFSTADSVDRISGRGMGLSVVAETARRAGGGAFMRRRFPYGAEVVISTPLSASRQPVLLAFEGEHIYGLPTRALEKVLHVSLDALQRLDGRDIIKFAVDGNSVVVPVVPLGLVLGATGMAGDNTGLVNIAVLRLGDQRLGVRVAAFSDVRTATVVALAHPDVDDLVQGAVRLEQDRVAVVINPEALMRRYSRNELGLRSSASRVAAPVQSARRTILIVDDSVTTRTLEKSILETNGFNVLVAVDGVDALNRLRGATTLVDLIVADVEMPRMDGFQLLAALKGDKQLAGIPVIMMTSRAAPDDVQRGMELGADAYLVKQTFDQRELLTTIGQLL